MLVIFANSFDSSGSKRLRHSDSVLEKLILKKSADDKKSMQNYPVCKRVKGRIRLEILNHKYCPLKEFCFSKCHLLCVWG